MLRPLSALMFYCRGEKPQFYTNLEKGRGQWCQSGTCVLPTLHLVHPPHPQFASDLLELRWTLSTRSLSCSGPPASLSTACDWGDAQLGEQLPSSSSCRPSHSSSSPTLLKAEMVLYSSLKIQSFLLYGKFAVHMTMFYFFPAFLSEDSWLC